MKYKNSEEEPHPSLKPQLLSAQLPPSHFHIMKWHTSDPPGEFTLFTTSCGLWDGANTCLEKASAGLVDTGLQVEQKPCRESGKRARPWSPDPQQPFPHREADACMATQYCVPGAISRDRPKSTSFNILCHSLVTQRRQTPCCCSLLYRDLTQTGAPGRCSPKEPCDGGTRAADHVLRTHPRQCKQGPGKVQDLLGF